MALYNVLGIRITQKRKPFLRSSYTDVTSFTVDPSASSPPPPSFHLSLRYNIFFLKITMMIPLIQQWRHKTTQRKPPSHS
jgi:hypothetical protein